MNPAGFIGLYFYIMVEDYQENYITGWVKLYRSFIKWEWFSVPNMVHIFIYCLLTANHKDKRWRGNHIKRGSFITSYGNIANDTGLTVKKVRTALKNLEKTGEIKRKSGTQNTLITICKYDIYQSFNDKEGTQKANEGQTEGNQRATTNNDNNIKNDNTYAKDDFLKNWNEARTYYDGTPSNLNTLKPNELDLFDYANSTFKKEEFHLAIKGLFNQEVIPKDIMTFRPKHLLDNIETYIDAELNKKYTLYK